MNINDINEYELNVRPGKVVKGTYTTQVEKVLDADCPAINGEFAAPYVATLNLPLGEERIKLWTNNFNGRLVVDSKRYNSTKGQRLMTLGKVVGKVMYSELKSIFRGTQSCLTYTGLPAEADETVKKAEKQFQELMTAYLSKLKVSSETEPRLVSTKTIKILPDGIGAKVETLEDKL